MEDVFYSFLEGERKKAADAAAAAADAAAAKRTRNAWIAWAKSQGLTPPQELLTA